MRNRGAQPGHTGFSRGKMEADQVIKLPISDSCSYGGDIPLFSKPYICQKVWHLAYLFLSYTALREQNI